VQFFRDLDDLRSRWIEGRRWQSQMNDLDRERMLKQWQKAVTRSFDWID